MKTLLRISLIFTIALITSPVRGDLLTDTNPSQFQKIRVKMVLSADTFILENDQEVRLIGLKAPDLPEEHRVERDEFGFVIKETDPTLSLESKAFDFVRALLEDQLIRLEFDAEKYGPHNTLQAYAFLIDGNIFINAEILRQGFADLSLRPPNMKYSTTLRDAYREARQEKRGLQSQ